MLSCRLVFRAWRCGAKWSSSAFSGRVSQPNGRHFDGLLKHAFSGSCAKLYRTIVEPESNHLGRFKRNALTPKLWRIHPNLGAASELDKTRRDSVRVHKQRKRVQHSKLVEQACPHLQQVVRGLIKLCREHGALTAQMHLFIYFAA